MAGQVPTNRTIADTDAQHVIDHNKIHDTQNAVDDHDQVAEKGTPVTGDTVLINDSAASGALKFAQIGNLPTGNDAAAVHDDVANEITAVTLKATPVAADELLIEDSAAGYVKKSITIGTLPTGNDAAAIHDDTAGEIAAVAEKAVPVSADVLLLEDSAAGNVKKRVQVGNLPASAGTDAAAIHDDTASEISAVTLKATPISGDFILIEDSAAANAKKRVTVGSLPTGTSDYFVPNTGGDMRSTIQTAINDADTAGGGRVDLDRDVNYISSNALSDSHGNLCGLLVPERVWLNGQGCGSQRSGGDGDTANNGMTVLLNTATPALGGNKYSLVSFDKSSPDWRGARISNMHLKDDASNWCDALLNVSGLNGMLIDYMSFGNAGKTGSKCLWIQTASGASQPTQYGRVSFCNFYADTHGIWGDGNNPDWEFHANQLQHQGGTVPVTGSTGIYIESSAWRVFGGEVQMFDVGVHVDGLSDEGKHCTIIGTHFEAHQSAASNAYEAQIKLESSVANDGMFALIHGCESGNPTKYQDVVNIGTNVEGTNIRAMRQRASHWWTSLSESNLTNNGDATTVNL